MNYSPLTIHFASLCLDILNQHRFMPLNHYHIDEIQAMIEERAASQLLSQYKLKKVIDATTCGVLSVLHQSVEIKSQPDVDWMLGTIETQLTHEVLVCYYLK